MLSAMYERTAEVYDLMNRATGKDYAAESARVVGEIRHRHPEATTLLDVACGTGGHLRHLQHEFRVTGVELEAGMLDIARVHLPDVPLHLGDMRSFDLAEHYDAVTCLFSAIGYMLRRDDLDAAVATMARHLTPGGVLVIEPWFHPDQWFDGHVTAVAANDTDVAVARVSRSARTDRISSFDFHYAIARPTGVDVFVEPHELALWTADEYRTAIERAGLEVHHDTQGLIGRGLFIGIAPAAP
jgi:ubiquinone/menaquinone biosynthesis C-methylase UbiE